MLTTYGVPLLRALTVTLCDFHAFAHAWCDLLGVSTDRECAIGTPPVLGGAQSVTGVDDLLSLG